MVLIYLNLEGEIKIMKKQFLIALIIIFLIVPVISNSGNIYKKFSTNEISFINGIVLEIDERYFIIEDDNEDKHSVRLTDYTGYYPSDYRLNIGDSVNVRCIKYSLITHKLYAREIQFLKENK